MKEYNVSIINKMHSLILRELYGNSSRDALE